MYIPVGNPFLSSLLSAPLFAATMWSDDLSYYSNTQWSVGNIAIVKGRSD